MLVYPFFGRGTHIVSYKAREEKRYEYIEYIIIVCMKEQEQEVVQKKA